MTGPAPESRLVALAAGLRAAGVPVGTGQVALMARAAALAPGDLYWAGRATLVNRADDIPVYDRVYRELLGSGAPRVTRTRREHATIRGTPFDAVSGVPVDAPPPDAALASPTEVLRRTSFARCGEDELARLARLMARMRLRAPERRTRRRRPSRGGEPDLRRTLRRAFRTGGEPLDRAWRERRRRRRRVVLVIDVSGSMSGFARGLLLFAHAALRGEPRWEAFVFGTRLTRVTRMLDHPSPDEALRRAASAETDWEGGTRIGQSVRDLLDRHGGLLRGSVVVVLSDGLDVGDPEILRHAMRRVHRLAHRVVWLNPLKEHPDYAPLARGMAAALPSVDVFASGHDLHSLEMVAAAIAAL
ncbi:MAG: VWA domain-containing protein [Thermoleophilia bacterium]|nr:VWA domain-containing protein [Thermoleophilia bacterium]